MAFPFHFSTMNRALTTTDIMSPISMLCSQLNAKAQADSIMYMVPNYSIMMAYDFPLAQQYGNNLLNPDLVLQTPPQMNNGMFPGANGVGDWFNNSSPWAHPWTTPSKSSHDKESSECKSLRKLLEKYINMVEAKEIKPVPGKVRDAVNEALDKNGTPDENFKALKEAYNKVNKTHIKKALLELDDVKIRLSDAGYKFEGTNRTEDLDLMSRLNSIKIELATGKADKLASEFSHPNNPDILRIVSYWNDKYNEDNNRSFIRLIADHLPEKEADQTLQKASIQNLVLSLINKGNEITDGENSDIETLSDKLSDSLTEALQDDKLGNLEDLADNFDNLYQALRMEAAKNISIEINTEYKFLNEISSTDTDIIDEKLVQEETQKDLTNEGIKDVEEISHIEVESYDEDSNKGNDEDNDSLEIDHTDTPAKQLKDLKEQKALQKTNYKGVYKTNGTPARFYAIKDGNMVELKDVKTIDTNGTCWFIDGSKGSVNVASVPTKQINGKDIIDYHDTIKMINSLTTGKNKELKSLNDNLGIYKTTADSETGEPNKFYAIVGNNLVELTNVKSYNEATNNFKTLSGETHTLEEVVAEENYNTIDQGAIKTYNETINKINKYKDDGKIKKATTIGNTIIYQSTGKENGNYQYFVVRDNELKQIIDCTGIENNKLIINNQETTLKDATFEEVTSDNKITSAKDEKEANSKKYNNKLNTESINEEDRSSEIGNKLHERLDADRIAPNRATNWNKIQEQVDNIDKTNIYGIINSFTNKENQELTFWSAAHKGIIQQIYENKNAKGADNQKHDAIMTIVNCALEFLKDHGSKNAKAYEALENLYYEIKNKNKELDEATVQTLDNKILAALGIELID